MLPNLKTEPLLPLLYQVSMLNLSGNELCVHNLQLRTMKRPIGAMTTLSGAERERVGPTLRTAEREIRSWLNLSASTIINKKYREIYNKLKLPN